MPPEQIDWDAYHALPEWEVTARMSRTARFRMHAATREEAAEMLRQGANGVASMQDLYDGDMDVDAILGVEAVTSEESR